MSFPYIAALSERAVVTEYVSTKSFRLGVLGMTQDGSLYRLCKAGAAITNILAAAANRYEHLSGVSGDTAESALVAAIAVGDVDYTMTDATNARAKDYFKDGYCVQPRSSGGDNIRSIWKSDAEVSDTYKIYVTAPFTQIDALGNTIHTYPSPWGNIRAPAGSGYDHFAVCPGRAISNGYYFWGKVRGPHWCWINSTWPGAAANDRDVVFHTNGTIIMRDESSNANQRAGILWYSGNYGDAMIGLQIE